MKKHIKELVAKPRKTASGGKFQADLTPADVLNEAAIAERWAASAAISVTMAKTMLASLEGFVMEALGDGLQLNFNLVSFYPRLSGALSARNANPEADALYVRGAVKARRTLMEGIKAKLKAVNKASPGRIHVWVGEEIGSMKRTAPSRIAPRNPNTISHLHFMASPSPAPSSSRRDGRRSRPP